ncbi:thioredoxin family protein [Mucisphaera calidilacus]|uniref:Thiol reductase thioredoxin n=1 Tax=Mucisphaera calidilacus TaxID=2527982 RepID=A0A518BW33_9BACT|nr:thioredoxin family protein [Mucisphaera calidilacus]QDU71192.1 hypothetical protein Pan265_10410 [Mucisphaera calidilacus]
MDNHYLKSKFETGLDYADYLAQGTDAQRSSWRDVYDRVTLTETQQSLLGGFVREVKALVVSGIWCGDCVQQMPIVQRIAEASGGKIELRWFDRDEHADLQERVRINAGNRVPVVIFAAEDYEPVGWFGDKTLARYRALAAAQLGAGCPLPGAAVPESELAAVTSEWVDQFERVHLILRLSGRLRQRHGD